MKSREKLFIWLSPLPILLAMSAGLVVSPILERFLKENQQYRLLMFLSWLPVNLSFVVSLIMMIMGLRFSTRAWKEGFFRVALLLSVSTFLASLPLLFLLLVPFWVATIHTWSQ